jgi:hypothetical protein
MIRKKNEKKKSIKIRLKTKQIEMIKLDTKNK